MVVKRLKSTLDVFSIAGFNSLWRNLPLWSVSFVMMLLKVVFFAVVAGPIFQIINEIYGEKLFSLLIISISEGLLWKQRLSPYIIYFEKSVRWYSNFIKDVIFTENKNLSVLSLFLKSLYNISTLPTTIFTCNTTGISLLLSTKRILYTKAIV